MRFVPNKVTRFGYRTAFQVRASSPTILVAAGIVGFGATAVLAVRASRYQDPIIEDFQKARLEAKSRITVEERRRELAHVYIDGAVKMTKLYAPALAVGTLSAASILKGSSILKTRQAAAIAAYSGLMEQFGSYRKRVADTFGEDVERGIFNGARGALIEGEKGDKDIVPDFEYIPDDEYMRPWFSEGKSLAWKNAPHANWLFLTGAQKHMNDLLNIRGHLFLNEVFDALGMPRRPEGAVTGWMLEGEGDGFVDLGFMTSIDPYTKAFKEHATPDVRLNFNVDGIIWPKI